MEEGGRRVSSREIFEDVMMLALKIEKYIMSQEMQVAPRSWKSKNMDSPH